jgi:hypothetical protein
LEVGTNYNQGRLSILEGEARALKEVVEEKL